MAFDAGSRPGSGPKQAKPTASEWLDFVCCFLAVALFACFYGLWLVRQFSGALLAVRELL